MEFTVRFDETRFPNEDWKFSGKDQVQVIDGGVLEIRKADGRMLAYAPGAWLMLNVQSTK
ncbi:hypothetical protein ACPCXD_16755 [Rhodococcus sp. AB351]|uniref:hypothetical protein n=1 Tax=Rhodococcus sp. AB351 TaxID=3413280 RepID=UPI003C1A09E6